MIAGGKSLIPVLAFRLAAPSMLVERLYPPQMQRPEIMLGQWRLIELIREAVAGRSDIRSNPHQVALIGFNAANRMIRDLERGRDNVSEGRDWTWSDTPEAIAAALLQLQPYKAPKLAAALSNLSKSTAPRTRKAAS